MTTMKMKLKRDSQKLDEHKAAGPYGRMPFSYLTGGAVKK